MRKLLVLLGIVGYLGAQTITKPLGSTPNEGWVQYMNYNGSSQLTSICYAAPNQTTTSFNVGAGTLTSIVVSSTTGTINFPATTYLWVGQQVSITGGATNPALASGSPYKILTVSGTSATITVATGSYTNTDNSLTVSTTGPMLNVSVWSIKELVYSSNLLVGSYWAKPSASSPLVTQNLACTAAGSY